MIHAEQNKPLSLSNAERRELFIVARRLMEERNLSDTASLEITFSRGNIDAYITNEGQEGPESADKMSSNLTEYLNNISKIQDRTKDSLIRTETLRNENEEILRRILEKITDNHPYKNDIVKILSI